MATPAATITPPTFFLRFRKRSEAGRNPLPFIIRMKVSRLFHAGLSINASTRPSLSINLWKVSVKIRMPAGCLNCCRQACCGGRVCQESMTV